MKVTEQKVANDILFLALSVAVAIILVSTGVIKEIILEVSALRYVGSFVSGILFVSLFTIAPASVMIVELAKTTPIWELALIGGFGALLGDLLIFRFVKSNLSDDLEWLAGKTHYHRLRTVLRKRNFRWLMFVVGAIVVISPIPDEIGLAMMGLSKMRMSVFIPLSFCLNALGILLLSMFSVGPF